MQKYHFQDKKILYRCQKDPQDNIFPSYTGRFFGPVYREENLSRGNAYAQKLRQLCKLID